MPILYIITITYIHNLHFLLFLLFWFTFIGLYSFYCFLFLLFLLYTHAPCACVRDVSQENSRVSSHHPEKPVSLSCSSVWLGLDRLGSDRQNNPFGDCLQIMQLWNIYIYTICDFGISLLYLLWDLHGGVDYFLVGLAAQANK